MRARFAALFGVSAAVCGSLAFLAWYLAAVAHLYATALVAIIALVAIALAWGRRMAVLDRDLAELAGGPEEVTSRSALALAALPRALAAHGARAQIVAAARIDSRQDVEQAQALVDTVPAALFINAHSRLTPVNRVAQRLRADLGDAGIEALQHLRPGTRNLVVLGGVRHLALVTRFNAPGREAELLISLQPITGELDIVEVEAWRNMTRVLAHEMMNSLTPIVSLSESLDSLLRRAPAAAGGEMPEAIEAIRRRSAGLLNFVQRYRQMSDLPKPVLQPVRVREFVATLNTLMSGRFAERGITYRAAPPDADLAVDADVELLSHAFINLLTNALEAVTAVGQPEVELACRRIDDAIVFSVRDNGPGIHDDEREQIFVPFHTTKPGGSGIGLSLARQIAIAHGGKLEVSAPRSGCEFVLTLPARRAP